MKHGILIAVLTALFVVGCAQESVKVTYRSDPPYASVYSTNGEYRGKCPLTLWYPVDAEAKAQVQRLTNHIANLEKQLASCKTSPALLAVADALEGLHQGLGGYAERKSALADMEAQLAGLEPALKAGMQHLGLTGSLSELET